ncbi:hypothetical protein NEHOM01_0412 [Nematocida homosporus]|uniref:uncharacterized protein n=1 Tax=Nematocida homosporus TaxID=1912981 RepID=UPI00221E78B2|nr:uncharacterized protein NEHOM01_0412 [Nematocida homosporus]KAI5184810.1 hypothetical protein NEHOM01_0412 [Nematocida homosporus]
MWDNRLKPKNKSAVGEKNGGYPGGRNPLVVLPRMINEGLEPSKQSLDKRPVLGPITRPSRVIAIEGIDGAGLGGVVGLGKEIGLSAEIGLGSGLGLGRQWVVCLGCKKDNRCVRCICMSGMGGSTGGMGSAGELGVSVGEDFVDAAKNGLGEGGSEDSEGEGIVGSAGEWGVGERMELCRFCDQNKNWVLETVQRGYLVRFAGLADAIGFYMAHRSVLRLAWARGMSSLGFMGQVNESEVGVSPKLQILQKAFSVYGPGCKAAPLMDESFPADSPISEKTGVLYTETERTNGFVYQASGRHSNITLQAKLRGLSQSQLLATIQKVPSPTFYFLSKHKYGTYVIQLVIAMAEDESLVLEIKKLLFPHASALLQHSIGNYVVQKMLVFDVRFVLDCFLSDFEMILKSKIGARAFKNCVKSFIPYKKEILPQLLLIISGNILLEEQKILKAVYRELYGSFK